MTDGDRRVVLAMDTSTPQISVAVWCQGQVNQRDLAAGRRTGALLPDLVAQTLVDAHVHQRDVTTVAVGVGPGPYTSLRIGVMFARAVATALGTGVVGACSLDITARGYAQLHPDEEFVVTADARRREVYWASYGAGGVRKSGPAVASLAWADAAFAGPVVSAAPAAGHLAAWVAQETQSGGGEVAVATVSGALISADARGEAGEVPQALLRPEPLYLRRPDATEPTST